jgi:hypothetical protein
MWLVLAHVILLAAVPVLHNVSGSVVGGLRHAMAASEQQKLKKFVDEGRVFAILLFAPITAARTNFSPAFKYCSKKYL